MRAAMAPRAVGRVLSMGSCVGVLAGRPAPHLRRMALLAFRFGYAFRVGLVLVLRMTTGACHAGMRAGPELLYLVCMTCGADAVVRRLRKNNRTPQGPGNGHPEAIHGCSEVYELSPGRGEAFSSKAGPLLRRGNFRGFYVFGAEAEAHGTRRPAAQPGPPGQQFQRPGRRE